MGRVYGKTSLLACCFFCLLYSHEVKAQKIDSVLHIYADKFQPERIYIHFDKPAYTAGETIWFKAYLMSGIFPTELSKNFYMDWTDEKGNILLHTTAPVTEASAFGQFEIPAGFTGTTIYVKAYTTWMLNFDPAFLYYKGIHVYQKAEPPVKPVTASIQFFPEGGDAVVGLGNRVAFKANDQFGKPVKVSGTVVSSKGVVVDSLKTMHDGMGYFFLQPAAGETYTAKWYDEQKGLHQTPLPAAKNTGAALQVNIAAGKRIFKISRQENANDNLKEMHVMATMQQQMVYMANTNLTTNLSVTGAIPTDGLPTGILQVTLFDANWLPVAERISFINNQDAVFYPESGFSALGLSKRGKNVLVIDVPDSMQANLSVAVTDAQSGLDASDNIISHLLLTSEIRGAVYNPAYYFSDTAEKIGQHLDLVMLTHGWRRYNWADITAGKLPVISFPPDTSYLTLAGKVFGATPTQMRDAGSIFALLGGKDSTRQAIVLPLKPDGGFSNDGVVFYDTIKVTYQFPDKSLADLTEVTFTNGLFPAPKSPLTEKARDVIIWNDTTGSYRNYLLAQRQLKIWSEGTTLNDVVVSTKVKSPLEKLDEQYASGFFKGDAYQFDIAGDVVARSSPSVLNYLQGRVAGLTISINGSNASLSWRGNSTQVYLDEMPVDASQVLSMPMTNVAYVKVFRPPFMGGFNGAGGAIAVYTQRGGANQNNAPVKSMPYKYVAGYTMLKQFYSPNYGTISQQNEKEDLRTTLYWNPMILTTPQKHTIRLEFYNNDVSNSFRVILEGMSTDGKLTRIEKVVE